jgi:uncharacterized protein (DUF58 family)
MTLERLSPQILSKIRSIQIRAKNLVNSSFSGEYQSAFRGRGMEFEEIRDYTIGDDIRNIDWNVTARTSSPYIKVYRDERELTVMFLVDVSASGRFGSHKQFKNDFAAEITALLAYMALTNNDKVGLIIFSDHVEHYIPPKKGKGHVWRLIREILTFQSTSKKTDFKVPLDFLNQVIKRKSICFLLSDFQSEEGIKNLSLTSNRHEILAISITDPREVQMPEVGFITLEDAETGETEIVDTTDPIWQRDFKKSSQKTKGELNYFFNRNAIDHISIMTNENYLNPILNYFRQREKRFRS